MDSPPIIPIDKQNVVFYDHYLPQEDLYKIILQTRVKLDLNSRDERYDDYIKNALEDNLLKISRFPFPMFQNMIYKLDWESYSDYNQPKEGYCFPNTFLKHISRVHRVYFNNCSGDSIRLCHDIDLAPREKACNERSAGGANKTYPKSYNVVGDELLLDVYRLPYSNKAPYVKIIGDGLPPSSIFMRSCANLLVTMVLRDMYRDVLKSPELFSLIDSSFNDEYQSLMEKDLSKYPKKIKTDKTYW